MSTTIRLVGTQAVANDECVCETTLLWPGHEDWPEGYTGQPFKRTIVKRNCPIHHCRCQCPDCKAGECCKGYYCRENK